MLWPRLNAIRLRLDALREGNVRAPSLVDRAMAMLGGDKALPPLELVLKLDRELDKVGVHTAQDAQLLQSLGVKKGRAGLLAQNLRGQAEAALEEFEDRLRRAERALLAGFPLAGAATTLDLAFPRLARVVKVADVFASPLAAREDEDALLPRPRRLVTSERPASARVAVAEFWAERARRSAVDVVQKRRDLDAAHELLLRLGSDFDRDRVRLLRVEVSRAREEVRSAPPTRSMVELAREVRGGGQRDPGAAYRALRGLYERAVEANDLKLAEAAHSALRPLLPPPERLRGMVEAADGEELREWIGLPPGVQAEAARRVEREPDDVLAKLAYSLDEERLATFELAAGCLRFFDVEEALSVEESEEQLVARRRRRGPRRVSYPTQRMTFEATSSLHDVNNLVISDPRTFLYDLASGRQPVRAYLEEDEPPPAPKRLKRTAVRVYVCDASGSMYGSRA
ncbi:MAG TPA: hypothetical protein VK420_11630, partial [Longimicrobium sp.]|nr:hypothetical protein [Longimicrobium sp.]